MLDEELKNRQRLLELLDGEGFISELSDHMIFPGLREDETAVWTLLLYSGYLNARRRDEGETIFLYDLSIPNQEVHLLFRNLIKRWFQQKLPDKQLRLMLESLTQGNIEPFGQMLQIFAERVFSYHDLPG
ncbi:MAG: hypothetical protein HC880_12700, partial [Bacteroidia bacterium]|nr:hypothetical protein [Bacteroidia bacterium]